MNHFGSIRQIAYLCEDIESTMQSWIDKAGLGPFTWYKDLTLKMVYKGEPSSVKMQVAIAFRGDMQIELIQQSNNAPSPYKYFFDSGRMGLHHVAYVTEDMDESLKEARSKGYEVIATIDETIGRYAYFQDPAMPETFYELLELDKNTQAYWQACIEQAKNWDGKDPITVFDMSSL
jgi:hypothetical protein